MASLLPEHFESKQTSPTSEVRRFMLDLDPYGPNR